MSEWSQHKVWSTDSKDKGSFIHPAGESNTEPNSSNMLSLLFCLYFFIMITISIKKLKSVRLLSKIQNEG